MSLILEALKKLDREKQAPDRGLVVVGPSAWPSAQEGRPMIGMGTVAMATFVLAGVAGAAWHIYGGRRPAEPSPAAVAAVPPVPAPPSGAGSTKTTVDAAAREPAGLPAMQPTPAPPSWSTGRPAPGEPAPAARAKEPKSGRADTIQLQAISAQEGRPVAILNDRLVREGDSFDGVTVVRIGTDEVEIEVAGRRRVVKF